MTDRLRLTILGCGSSPGTPRITGDWGNCDPKNPRNRRMRTAALVERIAANGARTTVVIDTGPDFREQMLLASVRRIDAVVYTHPHADHIHGIDDLRGYVLEQRRLVDIYADEPTMRRLRDAFGYCFETPPGSSYPPIVKPYLIDHARPVVIEEIRLDDRRIGTAGRRDRKSTRLNSSHEWISYAVFCLKKKKKTN